MLSLSIMLGQLCGVALGGTFLHLLAHPDAVGVTSVKSLPPEVLAGAMADVLPCFALPFMWGLAAIVIRLRRST